MARIDWSTAAQGKTVVPVLLIHGVPAIFYPEGVSVTAFSLSSPPSEWWPGNTYSNWSTYGKGWLSLRGDGLRISERAQPSTPNALEVSEVTMFISDVDLGATALFANKDNLFATFLAAEASASTTTITVQSTAAFPSSGFIYVDQEAIEYSGKTGTTFTGCTRGRFGSKASRHLYNAASGLGLGNVEVLSGPDEIVGRPATLWLCEITGTTLTAVQLEHFGTVGTGAALVEDGDGWVVTIDHAIKRLSQKIRQSTINVGGFVHTGNRGVRSNPDQLSFTMLPALAVAAWNASTGVVGAVAVLSDDAAEPDSGGWHPSRESFVAAISAAGYASFNAMTGSPQFSAAIDADNKLSMVVGPFSATTNVQAWMWWMPTISLFLDRITARARLVSTVPMPDAYVPIFNNSRVYVNASDYANVPATPTLDGDAAASHTEAAFCLVMDDDNDRNARRVARITSATSSGGIYYLTVNALNGPLMRVPNFGIGGIGGTGGAPYSYIQGFTVTKPTVARLGLWVKSDSWVTALKYAVQSLDVEYASVADAIDWDHMETVAAQVSSVLPRQRETIIDLDTTVLDLLANEAALNGLALVMHNGKVSVARIAEFSATEQTSTSITSQDTLADDVPQWSKGADGIVNTYQVKSIESALTVNVIDQTSRGRYGSRGTIECTLPRTGLGPVMDARRFYAQVFAQGAMVLGPLRYPYEHVTFRTPLHRYDLQVGDLVSLDMWRIPAGDGTRGVSEQVAQVIGRDVILYSETGEGLVSYTVRLNPRNVTGYAPSALVASGGISGAVVTLDTTTLGSGGFAGPAYADGGASTFAVGDLVRLVEIDATSVATSTQHEVTAVSGSTISLDPAPSVTFSTLAGSALKVIVVYDDWTVVASRASQARYCYLADANGELDANTRARLFAA